MDKITRTPHGQQQEKLDHLNELQQKCIFCPFNRHGNSYMTHQHDNSLRLTGSNGTRNEHSEPSRQRHLIASITMVTRRRLQRPLQTPTEKQKKILLNRSGHVMQTLFNTLWNSPHAVPLYIFINHKREVWWRKKTLTIKSSVQINLVGWTQSCLTLLCTTDCL